MPRPSGHVPLAYRVLHLKPLISTHKVELNHWRARARASLRKNNRARARVCTPITHIIAKFKMLETMATNFLVGSHMLQREDD